MLQSILRVYLAMPMRVNLTYNQNERHLTCMLNAKLRTVSKPE